MLVFQPISCLLDKKMSSFRNKKNHLIFIWQNKLCLPVKFYIDLFYIRRRHMADTFPA
jgi:hypothetical protein